MLLFVQLDCSAARRSPSSGDHRITAKHLFPLGLREEAALFSANRKERPLTTRVFKRRHRYGGIAKRPHSIRLYNLPAVKPRNIPIAWERSDSWSAECRRTLPPAPKPLSKCTARLWEKERLIPPGGSGIPSPGTEKISRTCFSCTTFA